MLSTNQEIPTINANREVRFSSAEHFCAIYEAFMAKGGLCVEGPQLPQPLEEVEFRLVLPMPPNRTFSIPGKVVSQQQGRALIQFVSFGDKERTQLSKAWEDARASTLGESKNAGAAPSVRACPSCGAHYQGEVKFCSEDGTALVQATVKHDSNSSAEVGPGTVLGSYRLLALVGKGGMGSVYRAEHVRLKRQVAVKVLSPDYVTNPTAVKRFFGEALAVNQIKHDHIVEVTDVNDYEDGPVYYIMELLEGRTLKEASTPGEPLPLPRALHIAMQVCDTLAAVHKGGIVHRDLKPDNIFLTTKNGTSDFAKILDFGVAKLMAETDSDAMVKTSAGALLGTPDYMAPEQVMGKSIDHRADIYALGVIIYEMVTGKKPVAAGNIGELVYRHMTQKPIAPSQLEELAYPIPAALDSLIMRCLSKDPSERPATAEELLQELFAIRDAV